MQTVLVTGGTGVLGRQVVSRLGENAADVRVLTRNPDAGPGRVIGDLATGEGVAAAVSGVDTIIHCATGPRFRHVDVNGTALLLEQAKRAGVGHVVYISIVGIDRNPFAYYQAKLHVEQMIVESGVPWTVLRATQFHDLVLRMVSGLAKLPVAPVPKGLCVQPVDAEAVAMRLVQLAAEGPVGRARDVGGPRVDPLADLLQVYCAAVGKSRSLLPIGVPGKVGRAFRAGENLLGSDGEPIGGTFDVYLVHRFGH